MKKGILYLLLFMLTNCGYQPLYSQKEVKTLTVSELVLIGNAKINESVISGLSIKIDKNKSITNKIILENKKTIIETSKDKKGQTETYKMIIDYKFLLLDENNILNEKYISEEFSYKSKDNKFDLTEYEINIEQNLINKIIEKLIVYMNI